MFDGYETFALILTVGVALRSLLDPSQYRRFPPMPAPSSRSNQSGRSAPVISVHCLRSRAVSPTGGGGRSFALI
jgi:hypothetical protein